MNGDSPDGYDPLAFVPERISPTTASGLAWLETERPRSETELSFKQREAIETARQMGYYDHPREATMADIAAELDLSMTTLRYRLHRAEAWATATALDDGEPDTISSITPEGPGDLPVPTVLMDEEQ